MKKCHGIETGHGRGDVRHQRNPTSTKINTSRGLRPYSRVVHVLVVRAAHRRHEDPGHGRCPAAIGIYRSGGFTVTESGSGLLTFLGRGQFGNGGMLEQRSELILRLLRYEVGRIVVMWQRKDDLQAGSAQHRVPGHEPVGVFGERGDDRQVDRGRVCPGPALRTASMTVVSPLPTDRWPVMPTRKCSGTRLCRQAWRTADSSSADSGRSRSEAGVSSATNPSNPSLSERMRPR